MKTNIIGKLSLALAVASALGLSQSALAADSAKYDPSSKQAAGLSNAVITTAPDSPYSLKITAPGSLNDKGMADLTGQPVLYKTGSKAGEIKEPAPNPDPGIVIGIYATVIPPDGVAPATALSWLGVSADTWTCMGLNEEKTIAVTLNVPIGAPAGDYVYTISANPDDNGMGWGSGGHTLTVSIEQYVPPVVEDEFVLDTSAPTVNITAPTAPSSFTYVTGGTPVSVAFDATEVESPITELYATVGASSVTLTKIGLGTMAASATGSTTINSIGAYTLTAKAQNTRALPVGSPASLDANLEGEATVDFTVNYDMNNCWLPPLSLGKVSKGGSTVPIKFTAKDANGLFINDNTVQVKVNRIVVDAILGTQDVLVTTGSFGAGSAGVRIDQIDAYTGQYIVNFQTAPGANKYRADVFFQGVKQASKEFSVSAK